MLSDVVKKPRSYVALVHVNNDGGIEYISVLNNQSLATYYMEADKAPDWLQERAALIRIFDTAMAASHMESMGRKFTNHMHYVYLSFKEYRELIKLSAAKDPQ